MCWIKSLAANIETKTIIQTLFNVFSYSNQFQPISTCRFFWTLIFAFSNKSFLTRNKMSRQKYCVLKSCEFFRGTVDKNIHMFRLCQYSLFLCVKFIFCFIFRLPNDLALKNQWILAIQEANNEKFCGIGVVCSKHFSPDQICGRGPQAKLVKGSVPSVFSVECIEYASEHPEPNECDKCNQKQYEMDNLKAEVTKITLNSEINETKLKEKIEKLQCTISEKTEEIYKLKKKLALVEKQKTEIKRLENELFALKTAPNINVCMRY